MTDALKPEDADERKRRQKLAGRVGREVEGVASVRPAIRDGWIAWAGLGVADDSLEPILTATAALVAALIGQERRRARATGMATRMTLAVTEHEVHLFRTRAMGRIVGDHVLTVPYGMVAKVTVGKTESVRVVASLIKVTIELADGSNIKLAGDAHHHKVFKLLRTRAAAIPIGTIAPEPMLRTDPAIARVLASAAGHLAKGAVRAGGKVRAARRASK